MFSGEVEELDFVLSVEKRHANTGSALGGETDEEKTDMQASWKTQEGGWGLTWEVRRTTQDDGDEIFRHGR